MLSNLNTDSFTTELWNSLLDAGIYKQSWEIQFKK